MFQIIKISITNSHVSAEKIWNVDRRTENIKIYILGDDIKFFLS